MKKLIESIDKLNESYLPPNHPDWDLPPAERMAKQNERIAADSSADAEVWHKGLKPAEKVEEDGPIKDYAEWKQQILAKHPTAKFRRDPNGTDAMVDGKRVGQWDKFGGDQIEESPQSLRGALNNALSKAEPGGKLDKKIKHHNSMVKQFA